MMWRIVIVVIVACGLLWACPAQGSARGAAVLHAPSATVTVTPRMRRYSTTRYALAFGGAAYGWLALWGVLATGVSARLRGWAERRARRRFARFVLYYGALTLLLAAIEFPLTWFGGYALPHEYGLSTQGIGAWLRDRAKGMGVDFAVGTLLLWLLFWLIGRSPRRWSAWLWAALVPILAFGIFLAPVVVDPLFNTFRPLPAGVLRTRIAALAAQAGISHAPVYVANQSQRTTTANAYVTGLGSSARIVVWDTTIRQLDTDEVVGIVAHEMGHYALHHVRRGFWETVAGLLILLPLAQWFATLLVRRFRVRWRLAGMEDMAAVPVYLLTLSVLGFLSMPVSNGLSRQIEHEADAYGLAATHDGPSMARAFAYFASHDLSDPSPPPLVKVWLFSHPPIGERINFVLGRKSGGGGGT